MSASALITIADALTTELNAQTWDPAFTAIRRNIVAVKLPALSSLTVLVVPRTRESEGASRGKMKNTHGIDIGILQRFGQLTVATANATTDPLFALAEAVQDHFNAATLTGLTSAKFAGSQLQFNPERLRDEHTFQALVTLNFLMFADR